MAKTINQDRRRLVGAGSAFVAAAPVGRVRAAGESSFSTLKEINAGVLNVGYAEAGPASRKPVILVHGWPYDIHTYADMAPLLAKAGYRVIVPYLRGYGSTRFLSSKTPRNPSNPPSH